MIFNKDYAIINVVFISVERIGLNLKKIELYGFKSFADKLDIEFVKDITGIVGPNGCGKSNVADAVRWVLGEQSPSVLRCKKMPEIIFSGTTNRKSLSYCEVSLYLDNENHFYPVDFDEVIITRKLYRSGDSEYYINRVLARWRDVIDLFRDSGIGREGYSIIGQGKIDEILSAKPEARRQIFEEAAGISRHKAKRKETEAKLERTRLNIERLNDMVTEIGRTLAPLEDEAKNAAKGRELKKQLKLLDVAYFMHQCDHSAEEREKLSAKFKRTQKEYADKDAELNKLNSEYNISMMDVNNSDTFIRGRRDELTNMMVSAVEKQGDARVLSTKIETLRTEIASIEKDIIQYEGRMNDREKEKGELLNEFNEKNAELFDKKQAAEELVREYGTLAESVDRQEKELEKGNQLIFERQDKMSQLDQNRVAMEVERDMLVERMSGSKDEYKEKSSMLETLLKERARLTEQLNELLSERKDKAAEKASADENIAANATEYNETEVRNRRLEMELANLKYKITNEEEKKRDFTGYQDVVRRLMMDAENNSAVSSLIVGTVAQKLTVPKDLQMAVEVGLGNVLQNIIVETREDASKLIDRLREKGFGRATFLPIEAIRANPLSREAMRALDEPGVLGVASDLVKYERRFADIVSNIMGRMIIVEDSETGIRLSRKYGSAFRMVTLDGTLFAQGGGMTGGSKLGKSNQLLSRESDLENLYKKQKTVEKEQELLKTVLNELGAEKAELNRAANILGERLHRLDVDIEALNVKLAAVDKDVQYYKSETDRLRSLSDDGGVKIKELNDAISAAKKNRDALTSEGTNADDFLSEARDKLINDKMARDGMNTQVQASNMELARAQNSLDNIQKEIATNKADYQFITQTLLDLRSRRSINSKNLERTEQELAAKKYDEEDQKAIDAAKAEIEELEKLKARTQARITELDVLRTEANKALADINERRVRDENALDLVEVDIQNLASRIHDDYDMDYEAAKAYRDAMITVDFEFDPSKAPAESQSLRRRIERLGPLNELAEQKYVNEKERFDDYQNQCKDLNDAADDLVRIINELTTEMTDKFTTSFAQINLNFQEVFKELFGGGSAKLELEQVEGIGVLEAGIEINAAPPGKKPTRISLLSGGEKALTAIAILFAIIKLKPMPFSILDEIEAALDEANATLFAQYLRKFSKFTQFIVITHRKPTMMLADMLYGVTQQELGISKLVSVELEDALKEAKAGE